MEFVKFIKSAAKFFAIVLIALALFIAGLASVQSGQTFFRICGILTMVFSVVGAILFVKRQNFNENV